MLEWKPKPLQEEIRVSILEVDKVVMNMRQMIPRGDVNQFLLWDVQWLDLFIWSDKSRIC